jgi:hypothetical protein
LSRHKSPLAPKPHTYYSAGENQDSNFGVADFKDVFGRETFGFPSKNVPPLSNTLILAANLRNTDELRLTEEVREIIEGRKRDDGTFA